MNRTKEVAILTILALSIFACSSTREAKGPPQFGFEEPILSKGIDFRGAKGIPLNPTTTFSREDHEVIASLKLKNLLGKHTLRWDWYDPNGNLYYSTGKYPVEISPGKYLRESTAWHRLSIEGERATEYLGDWKVNIYLDNGLIASKMFRIKREIGMVKLPLTPQEPNPQDFALIIGIEKYASLPPVDDATKDALIVREYCMKMLGVPRENIISLFDSDATKARLEGYLRGYIPKNVNRNTTLYIYFAGHGASDIEQGGAYLMAYDSDIRFVAQTGYGLKGLYEEIDKLPIKRAFVFLDSRFSGMATRAAKMLTRLESK